MKRTFPAALRERMAETIEKYAYAIRGRSILHDSPEFIKATEAMNLLTATLRAATLKSMAAAENQSTKPSISSLLSKALMSSYSIQVTLSRPS